MISRSENGPRCPHCTRLNPAAVLVQSASKVEVCIHCGLSFTFWMEQLPFYCTDDGLPPRCTCDVCTGKKPAPGAEIEP